ncbi:MAG: hypothetical protein GY793_10610 [Proteobacteria bacterium]|nr:hypothetical protein [Pseudomonadota bacterium]
MVNKFSGLNDKGCLLKKQSLSIFNKIKGKFNSLKDNCVCDENKEKVRRFLKHGLSKKQTIIIASILIVSSILILVPKPNSKSIIGTINRVESALLKADTSEFTKVVDINSITLDISNAIFEQVEELHLTQVILSTFKTNLEDLILTDLYSIIKKNGDFSKNLNNKDAVLSKLVNLLFGKSGKIIALDVLEQDKNESVVQIIIFKSDLNIEIPVKLGLIKNQAGNWMVKHIKNAKSVFNFLNMIESTYRNKATEAKSAKLNKLVVLKNFKIDKVDPINGSILVKLSLENISEETLKMIQSTLNISYNNQLLGSADIKIHDVIKPQAFYEKTVAFKITKDNFLLNNLATARPEAIKANLNVTKMLFSESNIFTTLELN